MSLLPGLVAVQNGVTNSPATDRPSASTSATITNQATSVNQQNRADIQIVPSTVVGEQPSERSLPARFQPPRAIKKPASVQQTPALKTGKRQAAAINDGGTVTRKEKKVSLDTANQPPAPLTRIQQPVKQEQEPAQESRSGIREREDAANLIGSVAGRSWLIDKKIAAGSFGTLFLGRHVRSRELVAIKAERKDSSYPQLHREYRFYQTLGTFDGIPKIHYFGSCSTGHRYQIVVMELLGPNLEDLLQTCGGRFSLKTVCMIALHLISLLEYVHSRGILYRDIKSENFLLGRTGSQKADMLHIVDFGLSKEYIEPKTGQHIAFQAKKGSVGTPRYMSINALQHHEQSRRDDMEALSYLLLYFLLGQLPWQGLPGSTFTEKCKQILEHKLRLSIEQVCQGAPVEFMHFMKYTRNLGFEQEPNYEACRGIFRDLLKRFNLPNDGRYDWHDSKHAGFWEKRKQYLQILPEFPTDINERIAATHNSQWAHRVTAAGEGAAHGRASVSSKKARVDRDDSLIQAQYNGRNTSGEGDCCPCYPKRVRKTRS